MDDLSPLLLQLSIAAPLAAAVALFIFGRRTCSCSVRAAVVVGFLLPFVISVYLFFQFGDAARGAGGFAFMSDLPTGLDRFGISLKLGLNGISAPLYLLAGIVGLAAGLYALYSNAERLSLYVALLLVMHGGLMGVFASVDIFFFYFFHELALIPTFVMICIWGGHGRRAIALEMTIYLTLGALLSLVGLIAIYASCDFRSFDLIQLREYLAVTPLSDVLQKNIFALLLFGFGILVSLFPFHSWAPRGYAAAPSSAAMLHAGVLKKFGLYGLIQIGAPLLPAGAIAWNDVLIWLALGNVLIIGIVTLSQCDLKQMIGYGSVMHMGYCFLGIASLSLIGLGGAVLLMFAHGLSVALLFLLATSIYRRTGTYDMFEMGGLGPKAPILAAFFVAATMATIGLPGFANFWGELSVFIALWEYHRCATVIAVSGIIISAIYGLRAVSRIFFGEPSPVFRRSPSFHGVTDLTAGERIPAALLLLALFAVGIWPRFVSQPINDELADRPVVTAHCACEISTLDDQHSPAFAYRNSDSDVR